MSLSASFYLLVRNKWVPLPDVDAEVPKQLSRPRSAFQTLGGVIYEQQASKANATWTFDFGHRTTDASRLLSYAASGKAGAVSLYDVQAAQANMLSENMTQGASATLILVGDISMPAFTAGTSYTRLVRGGVAYQLSYTTTHTAATTIGTFNAGAGSVNITSPAGTGARRGSTTFIPAADGTVTITWTVADKTSGARLTEGSVDTLGFLPAENTPCRVAVSDRSQRIDYVFSNKPSISNASFEVREIG